MNRVNKKLKKLSALLGRENLPSESAAVSSLLKEDKEEEKEPDKKLSDQSLSANFSLYEFNCKDKNKTPVPEKYLNNTKELVKNLEIIRAEFNKPIQIISGYRTPEYNKSIGGAAKSLHMFGKAADIKINGVTSKEIKTVILKLIDDGKISQGGVGSYPGFVHYDVRGVKARW